MRTSISKEVEFDTGHRVPDHQSKCYNPHGHRYRVRATCEGQVVNEAGSSDNGMLVDFSDLKRWLTEYVHDRFDHAFVVYADDVTMRHALATDPLWNVVVVNYTPTAENLARDIFVRLALIIASHWRGNMTLTKIELWETPTSVAVVER